MSTCKICGCEQRGKWSMSGVLCGNCADSHPSLRTMLIDVRTRCSKGEIDFNSRDELVLSIIEEYKQTLQTKENGMLTKSETSMTTKGYNETIIHEISLIAKEMAALATKLGTLGDGPLSEKEINYCRMAAGEHILTVTKELVFFLREGRKEDVQESQKYIDKFISMANAGMF